VERINMVKQAFWDGFEKRAISSKLLDRAAHSAHTKLKAVLGNKTMPIRERMPLIKKRMDQESKFQLGSLEKQKRELHMERAKLEGKK
jgi:hypothetical protein